MASAVASSGSQNLPMMVDEFRAGVAACLRSWSALRTAVEQGWGGPDSADKAEDLRANLLQHFDFRACPIKSLTLDDLEDNLAIYMEEEFSIFLEDDSEKQVADTVWRMYELCFRGDPTLARRVVEAAESALRASSSHPSQIQEPAMDDDDDDEDIDDVDDGGEGNDEEMMEAEMDGQAAQAAPSIVPLPSLDAGRPLETMKAGEYAAQPLFGHTKRNRHNPSLNSNEKVRQLGEAAPEAAAPIELDVDGFATVPTKSRRNARRPAA